MTSWREIRKESGGISSADLAEYPSWEFCLDEEHVNEQSECTMRPCDRNKILKLSDYCYVACGFVLPNGMEYSGWIELTGEQEIDQWSLSPEIFLAPSTTVAERDISEFSLVTNSEFVGSSTRVRFSLPSVEELDDQSMRPHETEVAEVLGTTLENLFPVAVSPLQTIQGWPKILRLERFYRPPVDDGAYRRFGEVGAPACPHCGKQLRTQLSKQCFECGKVWHGQ